MGWNIPDDEAIGRALASSLFSVVAEDDGLLVGLGRVVGDGGLYFYVQDVMVHPSFQGKGLGTQLMQRVMGYIGAEAPPGAFVGLMASQGLGSFYASFGFHPREPDAPGMYRCMT